MNLGLSENNNYNNHISACTTTDMHLEGLANPDKLNPDLIYFDKYTYLNQNKNNYDSDDEYGPIDDEAHNYTNNNNTNNNDNKNSSQKNASDKQNVSDKQKKSESSNSSESDTEHNREQHYQSNQTQKVDPDDETTWTKEEMMLRKLDMLRKLGELSKAGVRLSQNYSLSSDYKTMKFEYELHSNIRSKQNSLNWMSNMLIGIVKGVELLNDNMNPFDMKFDGMWSNEVKSDISNYYDVLGEIYEKYTTPGKKMAPELKLFLMLTGSAVSIQMHKGIANYMASNSNVAGDLEDDPDKISELRKKAAQKKEEQKKKIQEKLDEEHKIATERMQNINMLKKKEEEYNEMKNNAKNMNMGKFQNSLVLSESATAHSMPKRKQQQQQPQLQPKPQQMPNQMTKELQNLASINKMISEKKNNERKVMAKKLEITPDSESESESKSKSKSKSKSDSSSDSETESEVSQKKKSNNCSASVRSSSSRSFMIKQPNLQKMIGNNSEQSKDETSSVRQIGVIKRETAEIMMNDDNYPEIACSKSKDSSNKSKGRQKKISTK
jgi:hypothetical protein